MGVKSLSFFDTLLAITGNFNIMPFFFEYQLIGMAQHHIIFDNQNSCCHAPSSFNRITLLYRNCHVAEGGILNGIFTKKVLPTSSLLINQTLPPNRSTISLT